MTVILSATRYGYSSPFRPRSGTGDDPVGFSPTLTEQTDPDGGNAVKTPITRPVKETADGRFELSLPYRAAFFHTSGNDGESPAARDDSSDNVATGEDGGGANDLFNQLADNNSQALDEEQPEAAAAPAGESDNPVDILTSLLGG